MMRVPTQQIVISSSCHRRLARFGHKNDRELLFSTILGFLLFLAGLLDLLA
jgi:hypothetical protein